MVDEPCVPRNDLRRAGLVPTARTLLVLNELIFAYFAWHTLPLPAFAPTKDHVLTSGYVFVFVSVVALIVFGGWKAACLAWRWRTDGSLVWAWSLLSLYGGYGALIAYGLATRRF